MKKILVTNDDGIAAPGIKALTEVMHELGEIYIIAPDSAQSGMGHAITINNTLELKHIPNFLGTNNAYSCSGTPVDCVKMGVHEVMKSKPDLCVSGVNHGSNSSINVIYSGTMSAAVEGGIEGIPSIGFSLCDYSWDANFEYIKPFRRCWNHRTSCASCRGQSAHPPRGGARYRARARTPAPHAPASTSPAATRCAACAGASVHAWRAARSRS